MLNAAVRGSLHDLAMIQQRVANEVRFYEVRKKLEKEFNAQLLEQKEAFTAQLQKQEKEARKKEEQARALADLAFASDVTLVASDGTKVPAKKSVLVAASCSETPVFERMFGSSMSEQQDSEVKTDATAEVLRHLVAAMYEVPAFATGASVDVLLGACELADRWELKEVCKTCASALIGKMDAEAARVLAVAQDHVDADSVSLGWRQLRDAAAAALAESLPQGAAHPAFKTLSLDAILETMTHVDGNMVQLPGMEVDTTSEAFTGGSTISGPWSEPTSWLNDEAVKNATKFRINAVTREQKICIRLQKASARSTTSNALPALHSVQAITEVQSVKYAAVTFGNTSNCIAIGSPRDAGGKLTLGGSVTITAAQRQAELLNLWLLATERVTAPLDPALLSLCLRAWATGFDINHAEASSLEQQLSERGLATTGAKEELQTRLQDAMYAALPMHAALGAACRALANLTAGCYDACAKDESLFELDAASYSMVLAQENINVKSEAVVLEHAVRWASKPGRTEEMVGCVMPLVRFPLVSLLPPSPALKDLKERNQVVAALMKEALKLQLQPEAAHAIFTPAKHPLLDGVLASDATVPRAKRRKLCKGDKVVRMDEDALMAAF